MFRRKRDRGEDSYQEFSTHSKREYGLDIDSMLDNRSVIPRVRACFSFLIAFVAIYALTQLVMVSVDSSKQGELLTFRPCDPELPPSPELLQHLLESRKGVSYYCSTQNQRSTQPCACCVRDRCWRDVHIISNATLDPSEIRDRVDGALFQRHIPKSMQVCYQIGDAFDKCEKVEGVRVNAILRAIEKLRGWEPNGVRL